ncbi:copper radical oxidase [Ephemerocybe angulata]|uniref:Copper radical oxidase n=1 Tax=Ephemerocybe angulata TaxID=980116 RepID=A0A8H6IGD7_9AGAR|nr:copper radical oxidase [Tulosesus angulatus]
MLSVVLFLFSRESAWNGLILPGSQKSNAMFTPFYVPPGAKSYDSNSPLLFSSNAFQHSIRSSSRQNATVLFSFAGTGIEWFGNRDDRHGSATVYIDGKHLEDKTQRQQRSHTLRIVNAGGARGDLVDVDAFVVTGKATTRLHGIDTLRGLRRDGTPLWTLREEGSSGINAMQLAIISPTHALLVDKVEHNPLDVNGHPAWGALYNLDTHAVKPLNMQSNSFCAGGTFLGNGTLINTHTSAADFGDLDGLQAIRIFQPCDSPNADGCDMTASPRWYNTVIRIEDGSAMIIGGAKKGGWMNNATNLHGSNGLPIELRFFLDTLTPTYSQSPFYCRTVPCLWLLPKIPNGVRISYPMTGTGVLLPLSPDNGYTPEILLCGGSTIDDTRAGYDISSQEPASAQCSRMAGWQVEEMPVPRTMADAILLPTGDVLIVNGAATGIAGYGNVQNQVGASNADHPVLTPPAGSRFSSDGMPASQIARLYHSVASLTPRGDIMIAGSNPNLDRSEVAYGTEYRMTRPEIISTPKNLILPTDIQDIKVAIMDFGYVTHAVHANSRMVGATWLGIEAPPNGRVYPPGPGWLHVIVEGIPSKGVKIMVGDVASPPVDHWSLRENTNVDQYGSSRGGDGLDDGTAE